MAPAPVTSAGISFLVTSPPLPGATCYLCQLATVLKPYVNFPSEKTFPKHKWKAKNEKLNNGKICREKIDFDCCYVSQLSHMHVMFLFIRNTYEFVRFLFVSNWLSPLTIPKSNIIEDHEFALPFSFLG